MKYIATISGGKDSVTMCDLLLKNGYQVDYIVFNDTLNEFEEMYKYIDKVDEYFKRVYKKEITRIKPKISFEDNIFRKRVRGEMQGRYAGLPNASNPYCDWRRDAKIAPFDKWAKGIGDHKVYIGITLDEVHRCNRDDDKFLYPLVDIFKMREKDCKEYLINEDMENPLYRHFSRTGCSNCHFQSDSDYYMIWKHYPKVWKKFKDFEEKIQPLDTDHKFWFTKFRTCKDMEDMFIKKDKKGSLFDFSDEPIKDCFCKI